MTNNTDSMISYQTEGVKMPAIKRRETTAWIKAVAASYGKKVGDSVDFGGLLGTAPIMPLRTYSPARFISRGGRIPAPIHSLKN